ncbi:hypothetical protein pb186bvf_001241 [Paramecium bursaria]
MCLIFSKHLLFQNTILCLEKNLLLAWIQSDDQNLKQFTQGNEMIKGFQLTLPWQNKI